MLSRILLASALVPPTAAFLSSGSFHRNPCPPLHSTDEPTYDPNEHTPDDTGAELASIFSQLLQSRNISNIADIDDDYFQEYEFDDDEEEDPEEFGEEDPDVASEEEFRAELDESIKERMLSSPQSFLDLNVEIDMDLDDDEGDEYTVPEVVPDAGLSAGEVVQLGEWL